ncbi:MAG: hypothetical protein AB1689_13545 [Thermodesulfobacteriota bacterium]
MGRVLFSAVIVACVLAGGTDAPATVYTWLDDGTRHFTNVSGDVPEAHRSTAKSFPTAAAHEPAAQPTPETPPPAGRQPDAIADAYGRGVRQGAELALAQTRAVGELAVSLVEAAVGRERTAPPPPPRASAPAERERRRGKGRPSFRVSIVPAGYRWPGGVGYGYLGTVAGCPGCCCAPGLGYGFGWGRLVPHSHFFPSLAGTRRAALFFPNGHQLDSNLFLTGGGYWVD